MKLSDRIAASDDVVAREVGGEMVLLDLNSGQYFGLDPVGGRIWQMLSDEPKRLSELCNAIEEEFDAPRETIEADIVALATNLNERELIVTETD